MFPISWFLVLCSLSSSYELVPIYVEAKKLSQASSSMYSFVTLINLIDVCSSTKISAFSLYISQLYEISFKIDLRAAVR